MPRSGVSTTEYGIVGALIAVIVIASVTSLDSHTHTMYCTVAAASISSGNSNVSYASQVATCTQALGYGLGSIQNHKGDGAAS